MPQGLIKHHTGHLSLRFPLEVLGPVFPGKKLCHAQCGREEGSVAPEGASGEARTRVMLAVPGIQAFLCPSHSGAASLTLCQQTNDVREAPNLPVLTPSHLLSLFRKETVSR